MIEVRRIRADEGLALRGMRLRALAGAPDAFGSTLAEALAFTESEWRDRAARRATSATDIHFFAEEDGELVGMAGGYVEPETPATAWLVGMWVEPRARGRGAGEALVEAVAGWARDCGATRLELWVTDTNAPAIALYRRSGFAPGRETKPLPSNPVLSESTMFREL